MRAGRAGAARDDGVSCTYVANKAGISRYGTPSKSGRAISGAGVAAKFDLSLECVERFGQLHCAFDYSIALFNGATIERMARQFKRLFEAVVVQPGARPDQIEQMSDDEAASPAAQ